MTNQEILCHVDHTLLKATATWADIQKICDEAIANKTASVCIPPCYVQRISQKYSNKLTICTVIGFPLGYQTVEVKCLEAKQAIENGAKEIDMVINISDAKNGDWAAILSEIKAIKQCIGDNILKVIIETCYLSNEEKINLCEIVTESGANYIKTSTGFGTMGATAQDIEIFKANIGGNILIKAAGGIKTRDDMVNFINQGCKRLGTSSAIQILNGGSSGSY